MHLLAQTHAVQHAIQHAVHQALHHAFHHGGHHGTHGLLHPGRPAIVHPVFDGSTLEDLEGRVLMSTVGHHAAPLLVGKAAAKTASTVTVAKTLISKAVVAPGPAAVADPAVTDKSYVYKSFASDPLFGPGGPSINDVSQGELGDCYLLSVLSSVAKTDTPLVRQLVKANVNGTYTVTFAGKKSVTVDADLATLPDGRPAYAQLGTGNSLWVAITEKAYADYVNPKIDSYATIEGGWMGSAFTAIGLKTSSTFAASSATALATLVQKDLKAADFITMGTASYVGKNNPLVAGHAYEIDSVTVSRQGTITAITLRNPWGEDVDNGGYVTVTPQQAFNAFAGLAVSHA